MKRIYGVLKLINRFSAETTGYLVGLIVLFLVIDTFGYIFRSQIDGVIELAVFTVIASAYIGLSYTEEMRAHVKVTALVSRFSTRVRKGIDIFWGIVSLIVLSITSYAAFQKAIESYLEGEAVAGPVPYPMAPIRFVIAISLFLYCCQLLANFILDIADFSQGRPDQRNYQR